MTSMGTELSCAGRQYVGSVAYHQTSEKQLALCAKVCIENVTAAVNLKQLS